MEAWLPTAIPTLSKRWCKRSSQPRICEQHGGYGGVNYFIVQFSFGDLTQEEVLEAAGTFAREVLPESRDRAGLRDPPQSASGSHAD